MSVLNDFQGELNLRTSGWSAHAADTAPRSPGGWWNDDASLLKVSMAGALLLTTDGARVVPISGAARVGPPADAIAPKGFWLAGGSNPPSSLYFSSIKYGSL
jgi:hypothetical protein